MDKVRILVVEDEIIIADNICDILEDIGYELLEPAISYTEALATIAKEKPDLALLDIQLSGKKTGIDIATVIREKYNFPFIFLTSDVDSETIKLAKEVMPSAYLIKPFTKDELYSAIEIALFNFSNKTGELKDKNLIIKDSIFIKEKNFYKKVPFSSILFLKSAHVYVEMYLDTGQKILIRTSLNQILEKLNATFLRVHRGYIVNTSYLEEINNGFIKIQTNKIPVGKKYKADLVKRVNLI